MKATKKAKSVRYISRTSLIAALYATAAFISSPLQFAGFQFRLSEALCVLPVFMPEAVLGLFIGSVLANYITGCVIWDIIFGAVATLIGAVGARLMRGLPYKLLWLTTVPTVISNAIIIPFIIIYAYGSEGSYAFFALTVAVGEIACAAILGSGLLYLLKGRYEKYLF